MLSSMFVLALNQLLARENWAREILREHTYKTAHLKIAGINLRFKVDEQGCLSTYTDAATPSVCIEVPAEALPQLFDGVDAFSRHARISGDARFAETIARLMQHLRPDIGAALSPVFGNIVAHRVELGLNASVSAARDVARNFNANIFEYISAEKRLVVQRDELENWNAELARLRDDLARLEKRVERIKA